MTKAVILGYGQGYGGFYSDLMKPTGIDISEVSKRVITEALEKVHFSFNHVDRIASTGCGGIRNPSCTRRMTEIICNAVGVHKMYPKATLAVDVGGQNSKVIRMDSEGKVLQFAANDEYSAGMGKILEDVAQTLEVDLDDLGAIASCSKKKIAISNSYTNSIRTEIEYLLAHKYDQEDIAAAFHESIVSRVLGLINSVNPEPKAIAVMIGGVARNIAIVKSLKTMVEFEILIPDNPQIVTAFGAALIAEESDVLSGQM